MKHKKTKPEVQAYRYDDDFIEHLAEIYLGMNGDRYYSTFEHFLQAQDYTNLVEATVRMSRLSHEIKK